MAAPAGSPVPESRNPITRLLLGWLRGLRFPQLFLVFAALFGFDLLIPDLIPFIDEILFGIATLLLGSLKTRRRESPIDVTPPPR